MVGTWAARGLPYPTFGGRCIGSKATSGFKEWLNIELKGVAHGGPYKEHHSIPQSWTSLLPCHTKGGFYILGAFGTTPFSNHTGIKSTSCISQGPNEEAEEFKVLPMDLQRVGMIYILLGLVFFLGGGVLGVFGLEALRNSQRAATFSCPQTSHLAGAPERSPMQLRLLMGREEC